MTNQEPIRVAVDFGSGDKCKMVLYKVENGVLFVRGEKKHNKDTKTVSITTPISHD
jgi:hypothetical protein